jgi:hypothetical protein
MALSFFFVCKSSSPRHLTPYRTRFSTTACGKNNLRYQIGHNVASVNVLHFIHFFSPHFTHFSLNARMCLCVCVFGGAEENNENFRRYSLQTRDIVVNIVIYDCFLFFILFSFSFHFQSSQDSHSSSSGSPLDSPAGIGSTPSVQQVNRSLSFVSESKKKTKAAVSFFWCKKFAKNKNFALPAHNCVGVCVCVCGWLEEQKSNLSKLDFLAS